MTPYEFLGVSPNASVEEITAAYRTLAQIYHPDRYAGCAENVKLEAERRMQDLNEAYDLARSGRLPNGGRWAKPKSPAQTGQRQAQQQQHPPNKMTQVNFAGIPWAEACRERAVQAVKAQREREARERAAHNGQANARPKSARRGQAVLSGLGEARFTNNVTCRRCQSIQWLPQGWAQRLADTDYYCSVCDRLLLAR